MEAPVEIQIFHLLPRSQTGGFDVIFVAFYVLTEFSEGQPACEKELHNPPT